MFLITFINVKSYFSNCNSALYLPIHHFYLSRTATVTPSHTALNVDSTVFFEIYHASKQSFLYLKEFYIGELAVEDRILVPPSGTDGVKASEAFLEQLGKLTKWRLQESDMILYKNQKSF
jgi:hypothetical protein